VPGPGILPLVPGSCEGRTYALGLALEVTESSVLLLPFTAESVGVARRQLVSDLIEAGIYDSTVTDAALVISELLSNALQHAEPLHDCGVRVTWQLDSDIVRVSVSDGGGRTRPELGEPTQYTTGGRGLRIVARLSRSWGTGGDDDGTTVWAEIELPHVPANAVPAAAVPAAATESGLAVGRCRAVSELSACTQPSYLASRRASR
jgi:anti-sigma regulatory factor (Ser/Thr protein kinase)